MFIKNFIISTLALTSLYFLQSLLDQLIDQEFTAQQVAFYNALNVPSILVQMIPPAVLIATVLTLSGLARNNELIACYSIGISLKQVVLVVFSLVFMISCMSLVLQDRILPPIFKKRTTFYWREMKQKLDFYFDAKQDKIWYRSKNLIYYIRTFNPMTNTILGMAIYSFNDDFELVEATEAKSAVFSQSGLIKSWELMDGTVTSFAGENKTPVTQPFQKLSLKIQETPKDFQEIEKEIDGLRLKEAKRYIDRVRASGVDTNHYEVKFHSKISLSFIPIVMCLLGVPFSVRARREGGLAKDIGFCLTLTFFYWLFHSISISLGSNGVLPPFIAAWMPTIMFGIFAATLITRRQKV